MGVQVTYVCAAFVSGWFVGVIADRLVVRPSGVFLCRVLQAAAADQRRSASQFYFVDSTSTSPAFSGGNNFPQCYL